MKAKFSLANTRCLCIVQVIELAPALQLHIKSMLECETATIHEPTQKCGKYRR